MPKLTIDERLDVLLHVKWTVKEFDCNLTREIVDLIDREADLLNRCTAAAYRIARCAQLSTTFATGGVHHSRTWTRLNDVQHAALLQLRPPSTDRLLRGTSRVHCCACSGRAEKSLEGLRRPAP